MYRPRLKIAMLGTRGVPARYGGFETAIEEVGQRLAARGHEVTVFCRGAGRERPSRYLGMHLVHRPAIRHKVLETLSHTAASAVHPRAWKADVAIVFNAANAPLLPVLRSRGVPTAVHVDGLEWQRSKWGPLGRRYYLVNERLAVRWADALIADAVGIQDYYRDEHGAASDFIPYGAPILHDPPLARLAELGLRDREYHLVVARLEPENHVDVAVAGYLASGCRLPLVVVGSAPYAGDHVARVKGLAEQDPRIRILGAIWDQELLNGLYAGACSYVHGHSVGGTNPSLLRAMGAGAPVLAYDVNFNREVLAHSGRFWADAEHLASLLDSGEAQPETERERGKAGRTRASEVYVWDSVALEYEQLCQRLAGASRASRKKLA